MKKSLVRIIFFSTLAAAALSCRPDDPASKDNWGGATLRLSVEAVSGAEDASIDWTADCTAGVWSGSYSNVPFRYRPSGPEGTFGSGIYGPFGGRTVVCAPYCAENTLDAEERLEIVLPDSYRVESAGSFPMELPMAGVTESPSGAVEMRLLVGFLKLPVVGGGIVRSVQFTSLDASRPASGRVSVSVPAAGVPLNPELKGTGKSVSVTLPGPLEVGYSDTVGVYIPLPAGEYGDFEIAFELSDGRPSIVQRSAGVWKVERASVTECDPVAIKDPALLKSFSFPVALNPGLKGNVSFDIDHESASVIARIDYYAGMKSVTPVFELAEGARAYVDGVLQESGVSAHDFYHPVTYVILDRDGLDYRYTVSVDHFTGLPVMIIDTPEGKDITSKEIWLEDVHVHLDGVGLYDDYDTVADDPDFIRGRGNATWNRFEKKGYNLKLGKKASLLGMPAHKRWCLMANYRDRIKIRNDIAFYIANGFGYMGWNCHGEFVEVILNGRHIGMYEVVEQIKIDDDRVDVTEFETDDNGMFTEDLSDPYILSGGYVFMIDAYYDEQYKFKSRRLELPVEFKDPNDNITPGMMTYAQNLFGDLEDYLYAYDFKEVYKIIDMDSFICFWLLNDLCENDDAANKHSDFVHKDRGGKLVAGPVWDFDSFTWRSGNSHFNMRNNMWYPYLLKDKAFCRRALEIWSEKRDMLLSVPDYAERRCASIERSEAYDAAIWWPIVGVANRFGDEDLSFREALARMQKNFALRFASMEQFLSTIVDAAPYDSSKD